LTHFRQETYNSFELDVPRLPASYSRIRFAAMIVVKRYPNRKLYNTEAKRYVTLDGIADLIREGEEIQILDHNNGEDLTAVTLSQIIYEQEKKEGGFLPRPLLTGLIQSGGQTLGSLRRSLASSLELFRHVDQEINRRLSRLVEAGELNEEEASELREMLSTAGEPEPESEYLGRLNEDDLADFVSRHGIPSRDDVLRLNEQLDDLVDKLEDISPDAESA
jgi:polyhydroxyalkanoate synthesis repressor PhaR